jgi:patatin-related protein
MTTDMPSLSKDACEQEPGPETDYSQEIRFAVVMYGGVSLAVYINGVAQELLKLVRATAPLRGADRTLPKCRLKDTELVYRKLGKILARGELPLNLNELDDRERDTGQELPLRTRFVVDILSGSSAGGINSVALAKALARDQPLEQLKKLWIDEGDFGRLINDRRSLEGTKLAQQVPPLSLLNSQRIFLKLYNALDGMDQTKLDYQLDLGEELDFFVTATDIEGQPVNLTLTDKCVEELRHRGVFQFRHRWLTASKKSAMISGRRTRLFWRSRLAALRPSPAPSLSICR